jgi:hypothetical protein
MLEIIQLSDSLIIGKGRDRICYEHPTIKSYCIKISINNHKQSNRERKYFTFLAKNNIDISYLSGYLGKVKTNLGLGFTFDLIRDDNGKVSRTLRQSLESGDINLKDIEFQLTDLKKYLTSNKICIRDISPSNICCQKNFNDIRLFIIDGVSNSNINPLTIRLKRLVEKSINKAWKGLDRKLARIEKSLAEQRKEH